MCRNREKVAQLSPVFPRNFLLSISSDSFLCDRYLLGCASTQFWFQASLTPNRLTDGRKMGTKQQRQKKKRIQTKKNAVSEHWNSRNRHSTRGIYLICVIGTMLSRRGVHFLFIFFLFPREWNNSKIVFISSVFPTWSSAKNSEIDKTVIVYRIRIICGSDSKNP